MNHWLLKSEPDVFSIDDLKNSPNQTAPWDGVRNYQARNYLRAMQIGDLAFFYHSNAKPSGIVGIIKIVKKATPDLSAFNPENKYYDPKSKPEQPRWFCVQVKFVKKFKQMISLEEIKHIKELHTMALLHHSRLSVQPVTTKEWDIIISKNL